MSDTLKERFPWILAALAWAILGYAAGLSLDLAKADGAPAAWEKSEAKVPFRRADLMGELNSSGDAWALDHFQALIAPGAVEHLSMTLEIPSGGEVRIFPAAQVPPPRHDTRGSTVARPDPMGSAVVLRRSIGGAAYAAVLQMGRERSINCSGSLPIPGDDPYFIEIVRSEGGFTAKAGGDSLRRQGPMPRSAPVIQSGLQRVLISNPVVDHNPAGGPGWPLRRQLFALVAAGLGVALLGWERRAGMNSSVAVATTLPLFVAAPLSTIDGLAVIEQLRAPQLSSTGLFVALPFAGMAMLKGLHHATRLARYSDRALPVVPIAAISSALLGVSFFTTSGAMAPAVAAIVAAVVATIAAGALMLLQLRLVGASKTEASRGTVGALLPAIVALALATLAGASHRGAVGYYALAGLTLGVVTLVNVNAGRVRGFNLISLVAVALAAILAEQGTRFTTVGANWTPAGRMAHDEAFGWVRSTLSDFEALERGEHTDYPMEGYPVAFEESAAKPRVVCLGSSATGGAFQNDDLEEFYPARLEELIGDHYEVLNQGVGGWTSFHMARYFEEKLEALDPDVVTVYAGHNDLLTRSEAPYRELHARWTTTGATSTESPLSGILLYQGLRHLIGALVNPMGSVAVPLDHAEENMRAIATAAATVDARVVLMAEAISPDPGPLEEYSEMLMRLAEELPHVSYIEVPTPILARGSAMFLDDVHLTDAGHRTLAGLMAEHLDPEE